MRGLGKALTQPAGTTPAREPPPQAPAASTPKPERPCCLACLHLHPRSQVFVDAAQRFGGACPVVFAAGHACRFAQGWLVKPQINGYAFGHRARAAHAAQADYANAHAPVGGHLCRFRGNHARGAASITEQDDRRGVVRAWFHGVDLFRRRLVLVVQAAAARLAGAEGQFFQFDVLEKKF